MYVTGRRSRRLLVYFSLNSQFFAPVEEQEKKRERLIEDYIEAMIRHYSFCQRSLHGYISRQVKALGAVAISFNQMHRLLFDPQLHLA